MMSNVDRDKHATEQVRRCGSWFSIPLLTGSTAGPGPHVSQRVKQAPRNWDLDKDGRGNLAHRPFPTVPEVFKHCVRNRLQSKQPGKSSCDSASPNPGQNARPRLWARRTVPIWFQHQPRQPRWEPSPGPRALEGCSSAAKPVRTPCGTWPPPLPRIRSSGRNAETVRVPAWPGPDSRGAGGTRRS